MSSIYATEPPTAGKVLLRTNYGEIEVELWSREAPLASRNFVQLCLESYYDNCSFHRIIPGFMAQTGDPSNTGEGGESIWGRPFKDEFHSRLRYSHRGLLGMANSNKAHTNQSQFFLTFAACEWIDKKNTIFGRVTGQTIFNLMRIGEVDLVNDKPVDECLLLSTQVLINPFDDIVPRVKHLQEEVESAAGKNKVVGTRAKDQKLLSFGDDEEEDGVMALLKKKKDAKKRWRGDHGSPAVQERGTTTGSLKEASGGCEPEPEKSTGAMLAAKIKASASAQRVSNANSGSTSTSTSTSTRGGAGGSVLERIKRTYLESGSLAVVNRHSLSGKTAKKEAETREKATLERLSSFSSALLAEKRSLPSPSREEDAGQGMSVVNDGHSEMGSDLSGWHMGILKFKRHVDDAARDKVVVVDGLGAATKRRRK
jgi:peptidyl-prolyl cis-trans isomerase SDCCAG10